MLVVQEKWQEKQDAALAAAITDVANFSGTGLSAADKKKQKAELEARVTLLEGHASGYADAGPLLHCVVWHDGDAWRAAIDTQELHESDSKEGRLADFTPMTNFRCGCPALPLPGPAASATACCGCAEPCARVAAASVVSQSCCVSRQPRNAPPVVPSANSSPGAQSAAVLASWALLQHQGPCQSCRGVYARAPRRRLQGLGSLLP